MARDRGLGRNRPRHVEHGSSCAGFGRLQGALCRGVPRSFTQAGEVACEYELGIDHLPTVDAVLPARVRGPPSLERCALVQCYGGGLGPQPNVCSRVGTRAMAATEPLFRYPSDWDDSQPRERDLALPGESYRRHGWALALFGPRGMAFNFRAVVDPFATAFVELHRRATPYRRNRSEESARLPCDWRRSVSRRRARAGNPL